MSKIFDDIIDLENPIDDEFVTGTGTSILQREKTGETDPINRGIGEEFKKGMKSGFRDSFIEGPLQTLGELGFQPAKEASDISRGRQLSRGEERPSKGFANKAAYFTGTGIPELVTMVASQYSGAGVGALAGKLFKAGSSMQKFVSLGRSAGLLTSVGMRSWGANKAELEDMGATPEMASLGATVRTGVTFMLEKMAGPERFYGKGIENKVTSWALNGIDNIDDAVVRTGLMAKMSRWPKSYLGRVAASVGEETFLEEIPDLAFKAISDIALTGNTDVNPKDFVETMIATPFATAPTAILMGAFGGSNQARRLADRKKRIAQKPDSKTLDAAATVEGKTDIVLIEELAFQTSQIAESVSPIIGEEASQQAGNIIFNISVNLAANDTERSPLDYVETFKTAIVKGDINQNVLRETMKQGEEAVINMLSETVPEFNTQLISMSQREDLNSLIDDNDMQVKAIRKQTGQWYDEDTTGLAEVLAISLKSNIPEEGGVKLDSVKAKGILNKSVYKALFVHEEIKDVSISGKTYSVSMDGDGVINVTPEEVKEPVEPAEGEEPVVDEEVETEEKEEINPFTDQTLRRLKLMRHESRSALAEEKYKLNIDDSTDEISKETSDLVNKRLSDASLKGDKILTELRDKISRDLDVSDGEKRTALYDSIVSRNPSLTKAERKKVQQDIAKLRSKVDFIENSDGLLVPQPVSELDAIVFGHDVEQPAASTEEMTQAQRDSANVQKWLEKRERFERIKGTPTLEKRPAGGFFLSEENAKETSNKINAMYLQDNKLAIFYKGSTAETIVHEWVHHIVSEELLPVSHADILLKNYGTEGKWDDSSHERMVTAFFQYIQTGLLPENSNRSLVDSFEYIKASMSESVKNHEDILTDDVKKVFDVWFSDTITDTSSIQTGEAIAEATEMAQSFNSILLEQDIIDQINAIPDDGERQKKLRNALYKTGKIKPVDLDGFAKQLDLANRNEIPTEKLLPLLRGQSDINTISTRLFGHEPDRGDLGNVQRQLDIKDSAQKDSPESFLNDKITRKKAIKDNAKLIASDLDLRPNDIDSRSRALGGHDVQSSIINTANRVIEGAQKFKNGLFRGMVLRVTGFEALLAKIVDGDPNSNLTKIVGGLWYKMQRDHSEEVQNHREWLEQKTEEDGAIPQVLRRNAILGDRNYTWNDALGIALITRGRTELNEDGLFANHESEALFQSNRDIGEGSREQFSKVVNDAFELMNSTPELKLIQKRVDDYFKWILPRINEVKVNLTGEPVGEIKFYFPMIREGGLFVDTDYLANQLGISPSKIEGRIGDQSRHKSRSAGTLGQKINLNVMAIFDSYMMQAQTYISKADNIDYLANLLNEQPIVESMLKKGLTKEHDTLKTMVERERYATGRMHNMTDAEIATKFVTSRFKLSVLAGNVPSIMRQAISGFNGASELPFFDGLKIGVNMMQKFQYAMTHNANFKTNGEVLSGDPVWEKMKEGHSVHTQSRHDPAEVDIMNAHGGIINMRVLGLPIKEAAVLPQRTVDQITRTSVWGASYDFKYRQNKAEGMGDSEADADAFKFADEVTSRSQPAANTSERNLMQTGNEFERAMIPFTGQLMKNFDYFRTQMALPLQQAFKNGGINELISVAFSTNTETLRRYGLNTNVGHKVAMSMIMPTIGLGLIAKGRLPESYEEFIKDFIVYNLAMMPVIGPAITTKLLYDSWRNESSPLYFDLINSISDAATDTYNALSKTDPKAAKAVSRDLIDIMKFGGFPNKIIQLHRDWDQDYFEENGIDMDSIVKHWIMRWDPLDDSIIDQFKTVTQ